MEKFLKKYWMYGAFVVLGGIGGYFYWYYIGCNSGSCPITSRWHNTALYGGLIGYLTGDLALSSFRKKKDKEEKKDDEGD